MDKLRIEEKPLWERLAECKKPVVLYGMGNGADKVIAHMQKRDIPLAGVFASDGFVRGQVFHGHEVTTYRQAKDRFGDMVVLVAFGTHRPDVVQNIERVAAECELYVPDAEVAGGNVFTREFYDAHREDFEDTFALLCDERSRHVFFNLLRYKVSGKLSRLMESVCAGGLFSFERLELRGDEAYVDAGAYDGDTVREFSEAAGGWQSITALEPDKKNYRKLLKSTEGLHDCTCMQAAAHSEDGTQGFAQSAGRQSRLRKDAQTPVRTCRIDSIAPDATMVKLDVEGHEREALQGMERVIKNGRPRLIVSAYHRNEDLFALSKLVKSIRADYRIYLRRFYSVPAWDIVYYFL